GRKNVLIAHLILTHVNTCGRPQEQNCAALVTAGAPSQYLLTKGIRVGSFGNAIFNPFSTIVEHEESSDQQPLPLDQQILDALLPYLAVGLSASRERFKRATKQRPGRRFQAGPFA